MRLVAAIASMAMLAACASRAATVDGPASPLPPCCEAVEQYPQWMVAAADALAPVLGRTIGLVNWRPGHLTRHPQAQALVVETLQPLDMVIVGHGGRLSGEAIPGHFTHVAIHLGNEAQLRRAGVWDDALVRPHHKAIRAGAVLVEADQSGVHLSSPERVLEVDRVAILRPAGRGPACRRDALRLAFSRLGTRFDFRFDTGNPSRLFCAELARQVVGADAVPTRRVYGRDTILPDEIVATALKRRDGTRLVLYVVADREQWHTPGADRLADDLREAWTPQPVAAAEPASP